MTIALPTSVVEFEMKAKPSASPASASMIVELDAEQCEIAVQTAHRMFARVLMNWASDVLELRRRTELVPNWKSGSGGSNGWTMSEAA